MTTWVGGERRRVTDGDADTFNLIMDTRQAVEEHKVEMQQLFGELKSELDLHATRVERLSQSTLSVIEKQNALVKELKDAFNKAFPQGDGELHRRAHESWIEKDKAEREFWTKLKQNTLNWVVVAALSWIGLVVWGAFVQGPGVK